MRIPIEHLRLTPESTLLLCGKPLARRGYVTMTTLPRTAAERPCSGCAAVALGDAPAKPDALLGANGDCEDGHQDQIIAIINGDLAAPFLCVRCGKVPKLSFTGEGD